MDTEARQSEALIESTIQAAWQIPLWLWLLFIVAAAAFAIVIYRSERGHSSRRSRGLLAILRTAVLLCAFWMLGGWSYVQYKTQRPELLVIVDTSASMDTREQSAPTQRDDSVIASRLEAVKTTLQSQLPEAAVAKLRRKYDVQWFSLDETLRAAETSRPEFLNALSANGTNSRLGTGLSELIQRQAGRGTAAILLYSDGINTAGPGLEAAAARARSAAVPVYSVLVGSESTPPDLKLVDLLVDQEVYFGDRVTIEVTVLASEVSSSNANVRLVDQRNQQVLDQTEVELDSSSNQSVARLSFVPKRPGSLPLAVEVDTVAGEIDLGNNRIETTVNVQDKTLRVLIVQEEPTYEFRFLKHFLERSMQFGSQDSSSFEVQCVLQSADPDYVKQDASAIRLVPSNQAKLEEFDVFVFGSFDPTLLSRRSQTLIRDAIVESGAGCVFVHGQGDFLRDLQGWPLEKLLPVQPPTFQTPATGLSWRWQPTKLGTNALPLQLGTSKTPSQQIWNELPAFYSLGSVGAPKLGSNVLAEAKAGQQSVPLLVTQFAGAGRVVLQCTDETHLWTTFQGSDMYHQRYWGQLLRWASRGKLNRSATESSIFIEPRQARYGWPINFQVELGAEVAEADVPDAVKLTISSNSDQAETLSLLAVPSTPRLFQATTDELMPGNYTATLFQPATESDPQAQFTITAPPNEQANLRADAKAMQDLATTSRGKFYRLSASEQLFSELPRGNAVRLGTLPPVPLWNSWWAALLFISLLTAEWLLRRKARML